MKNIRIKNRSSRAKDVRERSKRRKKNDRTIRTRTNGVNVSSGSCRTILVKNESLHGSQTDAGKKSYRSLDTSFRFRKIPFSDANYRHFYAIRFYEPSRANTAKSFLHEVSVYDDATRDKYVRDRTGVTTPERAKIYTNVSLNAHALCTRNKIRSIFYINTYHMVAGGRRAGDHGRRRRPRAQGPDAILFLETIDDRTHVRAVLVL